MPSALGHGEGRAHVPAEHRAGDHAQLATKAADQIPDLPALRRLRPVQSCGAVGAGDLRRPRSIGRPRRRTSRRGRGDVFFRVQDQALGDILRLERLEDRPDFQKGVDAFGGDGHDVARVIAHTLPIQHGAAGDGLGHGEGQFLLAWRLPARLRWPDRRGRTPSARWSAGRPAGAGRGRGPAIAGWRSGSVGS